MITYLFALAIAATSTPVNAAVQQTVQQEFDAASALYAAQRWQEAVAAFTALEKRLGTKGRRSLAVVRVRKGIALQRLGRAPDALNALNEGLVELPLGDASLAADRFEGLSALGRAHELLLNYPEAIEAFRRAEAASPDARDKVSAIFGQARLQSVLSPDQAITDADRALRLISTMPERLKKDEGQLHTIRGRALLNAGQYVAAKTELRAAVELLGGLTNRVTMSDISARSDLAIASLLSGDGASAKKYLAYSASGTLEDGFDRGANMDPPECGTTTGLSPDDVAVVEFGIGDDGAVSYATPVYLSRPGLPGIEFARAVTRWSWPPERLAKIDPFFRRMTRIELRCSTASARPTMSSYFDDALRRWFADRHLAEASLTGVAATDAIALRVELAKRRAASGPSSLNLAPILLEIADNSTVPRVERSAASDEWTRLVGGASPTPIVYAAARLEQEITRANGSSIRRPDVALRLIAKATSLIVDPAVSVDATATNALRLALADAYLAGRKENLAAPLVEAVVADTRLATTHPLRVAALVRRSAIALARGDIAAARSAYEATGLSDTQCALIDASPAVVKRAGSSADYPTDAVSWGISGWAVSEFDIAADGSTKSVRAIAAYPPFVFDKPTVKIFERMKYRQTYRPNGGLGCGGFQSSQSFRVIR